MREKPRHKKRAIKKFLTTVKPDDTIFFNVDLIFTYKQLQSLKKYIKYEGIETIQIMRDGVKMEEKNFTNP